MAALEVKFDWSEPLLEKAQGEQGEKYIELFPADLLNREKYAKFLTNYLVDEGKSNGYVLNINASWGTGKTYFLNRWKADLEKHYPVVYIDAWKQDYSDDPLLTVVSSIIDQLKAQAGGEAEQFVVKKAEKAARLFKAVAPALTKGVVAKLTGIKIDEIAEGLDDSDSDSKIGDLGFGAASGKLVQTLIDDHNAKLQGVEAFKESLQDWIGAVVGKGGRERPAFIFIDELDRCRPSYAVEMLEVIKHFFQMEGVVFVVATDTEQLQHAVKAIYGQGFNSGVYLSRFFRRRFTLSEPNYTDFIKTQFTSNNVNINELTRNAWPVIDIECASFISVISELCQLFELSLRDTEQLIDRVVSILRGSENKKVNILLLASLLILHDKHHEFYKSMMSKSQSNPRKSGSSVIDEDIVREKLGQQFVSSRKVKVAIHQSYKEVEMPFYEILDNTFNKLQRLNTPTSKVNAVDSLDHDLRNSDHKSPTKLLAALSLKVDMNNTIETYKDWVELAVSFDD